MQHSSQKLGIGHWEIGNWELGMAENEKLPLSPSSTLLVCQG
ncbi:MAG: hypothetical protein ACYTXC_15130 [Nostoc sp.]